MNFLRRRLVHSLVALGLAFVGIGIRMAINPEGNALFWQAIQGNRDEFDRVSEAIQSQSPNNRRAPIGTRRGVRPAPGVSKPVEPKEFEIEYDDEKPVMPPIAPKSSPPKQATGSNPNSSDKGSEPPAKTPPRETNQPVEKTPQPQVVRAAAAGSYADAKHHYSIDLPASWQEMSLAEMSQINRAAGSLGLGAQIKYEAGFRRKNSRPGTYPYILVATKAGKLGSFEEVEQALEKELPRSVKKAENALGNLASDVSINGATVDRLNNRIVFRSQLDVMGIGTIQGLSIGHIGSEGVVFVHSYSTAKEFTAWLPTFERINDSFAFDEGFAFVERTDQGLGGLNELLGSITWVGWVVGAGLGAGAGAVVGLLLKPRRRRPLAQSMLEHETYQNPIAPHQEPAAQLPPLPPLPPIPNQPNDSSAGLQFEPVGAGKSVDTTPSFARATAWAVVVGVIGAGGWFGYSHRTDLAALWSQAQESAGLSESADEPVATTAQGPQFAATPNSIAVKTAKSTGNR